MRAIEISKHRVQGFLYDLMRDHLPVGVVEKLVQEQEECDGKSITSFIYCNKGLAKYAGELTKRLVPAIKPKKRK